MSRSEQLYKDIYKTEVKYTKTEDEYKIFRRNCKLNYLKKRDELRLHLVKQREMELYDQVLKRKLENNIAIEKLRKYYDDEMLRVRIEFDEEIKDQIREYQQTTKDLENSIQKDVWDFSNNITKNYKEFAFDPPQTIYNKHEECCVCFENKNSMFFKPCGHGICDKCLLNIADKCHVCRRQIKCIF